MTPVYDGFREEFTMHWSVYSAIFVLTLGAGSLAAQTQPQAMPMGGVGSQATSSIIAQVPGPLTVQFGDKSAEWTPAKLAALPHKTLTVYNEHTKANETYAGVPLIDLLTPLGVPEQPRGKDLRH
jgi:hypothetical protein